jgi:hypothetical protein
MRNADGRKKNLSEIYEYLSNQFGTIEEDDLRANKITLSLPFTSEMEMRELLAKHDTCHRIAKQAGHPIPESDQIDFLIQAVTPCGLFTNQLTNWRSKYPKLLNKSYPSLRTMLENAFKEIPETTTAASLGYGNAALLTSSAQVPILEQKFDELTKRFDNLAATVRSTSTGNTTTAANNNTNSSNHKDKSKFQRSKKRYDDFDITKDYCWSHGLMGHSSNQCHRRFEDHKADATYQNRMGGSNKNCKPI